ncbi:MAG: RNA-binding protein [Candidatus Saccharibacteria bacterium]|jgi:RNA recognition motif-containing protein|nr:RNA-binding protein [Candidatus Saccharibacteria bacterium]
MSARLYVGSLAYAATDDTLNELFSQCGTVVSAKVIMDRDSGQSKGFGFVEMSTDDEAKKAIAELNGKEVAGRTINVNEAKPQTDRSSAGGGGGGRPFRSRY